MVEKIIVSPGDVRGQGNIVDPKLMGDFETELCILDEDTEVIQSTVLSVWTMSYSNISISLAVNNATINFGSSVTLTATVLDGGTAVSGETVYFKYGADIIGSGTTNSSGKATTTYTPQLGGTYSFIATYAWKVSEPVTVTVNKINPTVTLTLANSYVYEGENLVCTASVTSNNAALEGIGVSFKEGSTILGTGVTGEDGTVTFTTNQLLLGNHNITAVTTSTEIYNSVTSSSKTAHIIADNELTVNQFTWAVYVPNQWRAQQEYGTVGCFSSAVQQAREYLYVKTKNGVAVQGITVKFYHDDTLVGTSMTTQNGMAAHALTTYDIVGLNDEFVLSAVVEGTDYYTGCTKEYGTIIRENATTHACEDYVK